MNAPWGYFLREAVRQAARRRLMAGLAVAALAACAFFGGAWALLWRDARSWNRLLCRSQSLVVYLRPGLTAQDQAAALAAARGVSGVATVDLVTPEQAAAELSTDPGLKEALADVGANPLPPVLKVDLDVDGPSGVRAAADALKGLPGADEVDRAETSVESLLKAGAALRSALLALTAVLTGLALLAVAALQRLSAWSRREELAVMRLVGAGGLFLRAPFALEGLLLGATGGALAVAALAWMGSGLAAQWGAALGLEPGALPFAGMDPMLGALLVGSGACVGLLGAVLATLGLPLDGEEAW